MNHPSFQLVLATSICMPDGVRLNADIYRPQSAGRQPALLTLTPYTTAYAYRSASAYARAGFAVVVVDVRGRGGSEGVFDLYNDGADGATCVDWLAGQDWCDGQVALFGGSYAGLNQWTIAARASGALKAIAPVAAPMPGFDADGLNGVFPLYNLRWTSFIRGRAIQQALFQDEEFWQSLFLRHYLSGAGIKALPGLLGRTDDVLARMIKEFDNPDYWAARVPDEAAFAGISVPVLSVTGTADNAQRGALEYRRRHLAARPDATHFLLLGPWNHGGQRDPEHMPGDPETSDSRTLDTAEHETLVGFYKWALRGKPLPALLQGNDRAEAVYLAGQEAWLRPDIAGANPQMRLSLTSDGGLGAVPGPAGAASTFPGSRSPDPVLSPEADTETADLFTVLSGERPDADWIHDPAHGRFIAFLSEPLTESQSLVGAPRLDCTISADTDAVDLACIVYECRADGINLVLSTDMQRVFGLASAPCRLTFNTFRYAARRLDAGSRIGLQIRVIESPFFQRAPDMLGGVSSNLTLQVGEGQHAHLDLPLLPESEIKNA